MQDLGYDDVFKGECTFKRSSNTLDAIFTNLPVRRKTIKEVGYSDHHMLKVEVTIPNGKNFRVKHEKQEEKGPKKFLLKDLKKA